MSGFWWIGAGRKGGPSGISALPRAPQMPLPAVSCNGGPLSRRADSRRQARDVVGAVVAAAVDEERRGPRDSAEVGALHVLRDAVGADPAPHVGAEAVQVQPDGRGLGGQAGEGEAALVGEEEVVHL